MLKSELFSLTLNYWCILVVIALSKLTEILQFLPLGSVSSVETEEVGHFDNGVSHVIHQPGGFPFGNKLHDQIYVSK